MDEPTSYGDALSRFFAEPKSDFRIEDLMGSQEHRPHTQYIVRTTERAANDSETNATR